MKKIVCLSIAAVMMVSCAVRPPSAVSENTNQDHLLLSVLWFQKSAEMRALFYQGYNIAERSLSEKLKNRKSDRPCAVIMDIDETILDNSPSEVYLIRNSIPFSDKAWKAWVSMSTAEACPGALDFVEYARMNGVEVFYVSNREMPDELQPTIDNLRKLGFPFGDREHLILKSLASSKEMRRKVISETHEILMMIGDNLADFDMVFDIRGADLGFGAVEGNREKFGHEFIILPNPMYGPWINAAIKDSEGKTEREKIIDSLKGY